MKRETLRHPKLYDLAARLNVDRPTALGYLTLLWDFVADSAIQGDIGKWPDGAIARSCDFGCDPEAFISALVDARWIDRDEQHRLLVHDWSDHCERWIKLKAEKLGLRFVVRTATRSAEPSIDAPTGASPPCDQTKPNPSKPNRTKKQQSFEVGQVELPFNTEAFARTWSDWVSHRVEIKKPLTATSVKQQLSKFVDWGEPRSIAAINHTIANGWVGLREPDGDRTNKYPPIPEDF